MQNDLCSAYFNLLIKLIFFHQFLLSSFFRLITLYPQPKQVHSYSYASHIFPTQCLQRVPYFLSTSSSVSSNFYLLYF